MATLAVAMPKVVKYRLLDRIHAHASVKHGTPYPRLDAALGTQSFKKLTSHTFTVVSSPAAARRRPLGVNARR